MMRLCLSILWLFVVSPLVSHSQGIRREPLRYVPADSVVFLDRDKTNFALSALVVDTALRAYPYRLYDRAQVPEAAGKRFAADDFYGLAARIDHLAALLPWTADSRPVDTIEYDLYNIVLPLLNRPSFERHPAAQVLRSAAALVYMTDDEGLYVNLFANAFARIKTETLDFTVDQITGMPFHPHVRFRLGRLPSLTPLAVRVRVPAWQRTPLTVYVNGHEVECPVENGYLVVRRRWNSGDELFFDFDLSPRRLPPPRLLRRGPLLYVADAPAEGPVSEADEENAAGHLRLQGEGWTAQPAMDL